MPKRENFFTQLVELLSEVNEIYLMRNKFIYLRWNLDLWTPYVDTMLLWTLFLGPVHGVHSIISFTTVDTSQLWTLFGRPSGVHISEVHLLFYFTLFYFFSDLQQDIGNPVLRSVDHRIYYACPNAAIVLILQIHVHVFLLYPVIVIQVF